MLPVNLTIRSEVYTVYLLALNTNIAVLYPIHYFRRPLLQFCSNWWLTITLHFFSISSFCILFISFSGGACYDLKLKVLSNKITLVLSNTRELDRVPSTK